MEGASTGLAKEIGDRLDRRSLRYVLRDLGIELLTRQSWESRRGCPKGVTE
jgi:hypothetical protein